jgi:hypothetical protein
MGTRENKVQAEILQHLKSKNILCWRNNNTAVYDSKIHSYRSFTGMKGVGDILAVHNGVFYSIECKAGTKQSADQILFQKRLERAGGVYIVARNIADIDHL